MNESPFGLIKAWSLLLLIAWGIAAILRQFSTHDFILVGVLLWICMVFAAILE